jgi:hypothetical protein
MTLETKEGVPLTPPFFLVGAGLRSPRFVILLSSGAATI